MHNSILKNSVRDTRDIFSFFAMILMLSIALSLVVGSGLIAVEAHTPPLSIPTWAYLSVQPNPVGVGQEAFVNFWLDKAPPTASAQYGDRWQGFKVTVTKPDGTVQDLPLGARSASDAVGGSWATYTPTAVGLYTFVFSFPGQTIKGENPGPSGTASAIFVGDYFEPSTSSRVTLVVQQERISYFSSTPLPTDYWERPINSENLEWYTLGGNWLGLWQQGNGGSSYNASGNFQPYTTMPNTAHILWTKPLAFGGIIGGEFGGTEYASSYYQTPQYECKFRGIIINGVLYYRVVPGSIANAQRWIALDLRTGETLWTKNTTASMLCGQTLSYVSPNQFGALAYLWSTEATVKPNTGSTFGMYDAMTGDWILNVVNATTFRIVEADDGSLLGYYINSTDKTLNLWNSTKCIIGPTNIPTAGYPAGWMWRPTQGGSIPFSYGIQWSAPIATTILGNAIDPLMSISTLSSDVVLLTSIPALVGGYSWQPGWKIIAGYSAKDGHLIWGPVNMTLTPWARVTMSPAMQGKWFEFDHESMTWSAFNLYTGQKIWGPSVPYTSAWGYYVCYPPIVAYGKLFTCDFGGYVHAYDVNTGNQLWVFSTGSSGYESPYGNFPLLHLECVADGKILVTGGHTYSPPLFRGSKLWCLDAATGEPIWNIANFVSANQATGVIADGYFVNENAYDNQIYCYGKGLSATTVSAPDTATPKGTPILLKGTVTDQSPGQTCFGIPAAGTPAISDDSMTAWMEYMYMQKPKPSNATGVSVHLTAFGPDGNPIHIGVASTDTNGKYGITWSPSAEGTYHIKAAFEGTNSYFSSEDTTYLAVGPAASTATSPAVSATPTTPTLTPSLTPMPTTSPSPIVNPQAESATILYVAIVAVIIIGAITAVAIFLRKRK